VLNRQPLSAQRRPPGHRSKLSSRKTRHRVANARRSLASTSSMQTQFAGAAHGIVPCRSTRAGFPDTEVSIRAPRRRRLTIVPGVFAEPPRERSVFGESARRAGFSTQQQRQLSGKLETCRHGGRSRISWKLAATGAAHVVPNRIARCRVFREVSERPGLQASVRRRGPPCSRCRRPRSPDGSSRRPRRPPRKLPPHSNPCGSASSRRGISWG